MRLGPVIMFGAAFVFAVIASLLVRNALSDKGESATPVAMVAPATKEILVAARDLHSGEKLTPALVREASAPAASLPKGAFLSREALFKGGEGPTLAVAVMENEPILPGKLSTPGQEGAIMSKLGEGMRGVPVRLADSGGAGSIVQPEDRVDVLLTHTDRGVDGNKATIITIAQNLRVLAVDNQATKRSAGSPPAKTVTLEASVDDANKLTLANTVGPLSLTLSKGAGGKASSITDLNELLKLGGGASLQNPTVTIVRSTQREDYRVPSEAGK